MWNIQTGDSIGILTGHQSRIWSLCYNPQLDILCSCSEDETIKLWHIQTGACLNTLKMPKPYQGTNIAGVTGLTEATITTLKALGAKAYSTTHTR